MTAEDVTAVGWLTNKLFGWTWCPIVNMARTIILGIFSNLTVGSLLIVDEINGTKHCFGQPCSAIDNKADNGTESVEVVVKHELFWLRVVLFADIGFGESYMLGEFDCDDLTSFFQLFIKNRDRLNGGVTFFSSLSLLIRRLLRCTNTLANSLLNVSAHYDISNEMFTAFLSKDMTYSCPIWKTSPRDGRESLEDAQMTKLLRFIEGAKVKQTDHVLEIGTGWGSFAIEAVKRTGCRVTSITLSRRQKELAQQRIKLAGLSHRIEVKLMDYRQVSTKEPFDKIISIEMLEAVGEVHLAEYFAGIDRLLKKEGGIAMFQCITVPEELHLCGGKEKGFISEYIFPGGYLPSAMELLGHISTQSKGTLTLERIENIGGHYTKALRLWREDFMSNFQEIIRPALLESLPTMSEESVEVFRRKWEYYFTSCEAGFATKYICDVIITVSRTGTMELVEDIPF